MELRRLALVLFCLPLAAQTGLYLRYGGHDSYRSISTCTNATPIVCTTTADHGFEVGDYIYIQLVEGNTAANGVRKVKAAPTTTTFSITDTSDADVAGNGAFSATGFPRVGKVQETTVPAHPRALLDGAAGSVTSAMVAGVNTSTHPAYLGAISGLAEYTAAPASYYAYTDVYYGAAPLAAAMAYFLDNAKTAEKAAAVHWINNIEKMKMDRVAFGSFTSCDEISSLCGEGTPSNYSGFMLADWSKAYSTLLGADAAALTSGEKAAFRNKMLNGVGEACTNQLHQDDPEAGTVSVITGALTTVVGDAESGFDFSGLTANVSMVAFRIGATSYTRMVTSVSAGSFTVNSNLAAGAGLHYYLVDSWSTGNCGLAWYSAHHTYQPETSRKGHTTTLAAQLDPEDTTITLTVDHPATFGGQWWAYVGTEWIKLGSKVSGATYNCTRAQLYSTLSAVKVSGTAVTLRTHPPGDPGTAARHNLASIRLYGEIVAGVALAAEDTRARDMLMRAWNFWHDYTYPDQKNAWAGMNQSAFNPGYLGGFQGGYFMYIAMLGKTNFSPAIDVFEPFLCKTPTYTWLYGRHAVPLTSGATHYRRFLPLADSASDYQMAAYPRQFMTLLMAPKFCSAAHPDLMNYLRDWYVNNTGAWSTTEYAGDGFGLAPLALAMQPASAGGTVADFRANLPTTFVSAPHDDYDVSVSNGWLVSHTDWTDTASTLLQTFTDLAEDHIGQPKPGHYALARNGSVLLGGSGAVGVTSGAWDSTNGVWSHNFTYVGTANSNSQCDLITQPAVGYNSQTIDIDRWLASDSAAYWALDAKNKYVAARGVTRAKIHGVHFKSSSADFIVFYKDFASTVTQDFQEYMHFNRRELADTTAASAVFARTDGDITSKKYSAMVSAKILMPTDAAKISHALLSSGHANTVELVEAGATAAEFLWVFKPSTSLSDTMPTASTLSPTGWRGVQIDGAAPKVALFPRSGAVPDSLSVTTTHDGTAQYILACPQNGTYEVEMGGTPVTGSPFTCTQAVGAMEFTSAAGTLTIGETTPTTMTVLPLTLSFSGTVGGTDPVAQAVAVTCSGECTAAADESCDWLAVTGSGATPATLTFTPSLTGVDAGAHTCSVAVSATEATEGSPAAVSVSLLVADAPAAISTRVSKGRARIK